MVFPLDGLHSLGKLALQMHTCCWEGKQLNAATKRTLAGGDWLEVSLGGPASLLGRSSTL